ncbi:hypothetical protein [Streptomyces sp. ME109]|uniref:hypothetical protein n=1 Tax=Streptomyces sp. me109 TaxID=1827853 RepID=UPI0021C84221|nr:hypothetical protein [Streptomyces sp. me109]
MGFKLFRGKPDDRAVRIVAGAAHVPGADGLDVQTQQALVVDPSDRLRRGGEPLAQLLAPFLGERQRSAAASTLLLLFDDQAALYEPGG